MAEPLLSFIITTHERPDDAIACVESILSQDYGSIEVILVTSPAGDATEILESRFADDQQVKVIEEHSRRGPAAAGNVAFENATGEIIVSVDDDAVFSGTDAATSITQEFQANPDLGILAFRIIDYDTDEVFRHEIPVGPDGHEPGVRHPTTYFIGAGAAFRSEAIEKTNGYPEDFFYHMQELDLSFQIIDAGYEAIYTPDIVVRHKRSKPGRPEDLERWKLILENRIKVAVRHLPVRYVLSSLIFWTPYIFYRSRGSFSTILRAYADLVADIGDLAEQRNPINTSTQRRLRRAGGRLWY